MKMYEGPQWAQVAQWLEYDSNEIREEFDDHINLNIDSDKLQSASFILDGIAHTLLAGLNESRDYIIEYAIIAVVEDSSAAAMTMWMGAIVPEVIGLLCSQWYDKDPTEIQVTQQYDLATNKLMVKGKLVDYAS